MRPRDPTGGADELMRLASHALVALTIEIDDEVEQRMPHYTTRDRTTARVRGTPWLVSTAMWFNCLRYVTDDGIAVAELERIARTPTNLDGMRRWGYVTIDGSRAKGRVTLASVLQPTAAGRLARALWPELIEVVEQRWRERLGPDRVAGLRDALSALVGRFEWQLPACLPIVGHGLWTRGRATPEKAGAPDGPEPFLIVLLARVLSALALGFERGSPVSLALAANTLRVLDGETVLVAEIPRLTGVSKEANTIALGVLQRRGFVVVERDAVRVRSNVARLTPEGRALRATCRDRLVALGARWSQRFGEETVSAVHAALAECVERGAEASLEHPPGSWRAQLPAPGTLPHFPVVTHRGGFPDGS